jgi:hypothetical protein
MTHPTPDSDRGRGGCAIRAPPEPCGFPGEAAARCRATRRTPSTLARDPSASPAGSAYSVPRSPSAVSTALGYSRRRPLPRRRTGRWPILRLACPWSVRSEKPSPDPQAGTTRSRGVLSPTTHPGEASPVLPGGSKPRHLPPSGFDYPLGGLLLATPGGARRPPGIHGVLPSGSCTSRPAVPLSGPRLSCRFLRPARRRPAATPEDDSGPGRGPTRHALAVAAEPCPPGRSPLQGFLLRAPSARLPGPSPSCPFGRKCSLRFHFRAGLQGIVCGGSGLSLSGLPAFLGFGTFPDARLLGRPPSRAHGFASAQRGFPPKGPPRDAETPDLSSARDSLGA